MRYPSARLYEEVAYIASHFHWSYDHIMGMDHRERQQWIAEIARAHQAFNDRQPSQ